MGEVKYSARGCEVVITKKEIRIRDSGKVSRDIQLDFIPWDWRVRLFAGVPREITIKVDKKRLKEFLAWYEEQKRLQELKQKIEEFQREYASRVKVFVNGKLAKIETDWIESLGVVYCPFCGWALMDAKGELMKVREAMNLVKQAQTEPPKVEAYKGQGMLFCKGCQQVYEFNVEIPDSMEVWEGAKSLWKKLKS